MPMNILDTNAIQQRKAFVLVIAFFDPPNVVVTSKILVRNVLCVST